MKSKSPRSHYEIVKSLSIAWKESDFLEDVRIFCPDGKIEITLSEKVKKVCNSQI